MKQNIIELDCRGLDFTEFKADVRTKPGIRDAKLLLPLLTLMGCARVSGRPKDWNPPPSS